MNNVVYSSPTSTLLRPPKSLALDLCANRHLHAIERT